MGLELLVPLGPVMPTYRGVAAMMGDLLQGRTHIQPLV